MEVSKQQVVIFFLISWIYDGLLFLDIFCAHSVYTVQIFTLLLIIFFTFWSVSWLWKFSIFCSHMSKSRWKSLFSSTFNLTQSNSRHRFLAMLSRPTLRHHWAKKMNANQTLKSNNHIVYTQVAWVCAKRSKA